MSPLSRAFKLLARSLLLLPWLTFALSGDGRCDFWEDARLGGHLKSLDIQQQAPKGSGLSSGAISSNRLRLDLTGAPGGLLDAEFSVEDVLLYVDPPLLLPLPSPSVNRRVDLEKSWNEAGRLKNALFIDRLNLKWKMEDFELAVGRQAVGFGRISLFSPLDIIAPFPPDALDTEVRPGVDALRLSGYADDGTEFGIISVFGDGKENNSHLATAEGNLAETDLLGVAGLLRERPMAGFGFAGQAAGVGIKAEGAWYDGRNTQEPEGDLHERFFIAALEFDYRFENGLILFAELLRNGAGADRVEDYPKAAASAPFREGLSFLLGRHYLLTAPSYQLHPLADLSALLIWNLDDDSWLLRPLLDLSLSDDLRLQAFWAVTVGKEPRDSPFFAPRSEFGSAGDGGGLFIKYFF